MSLLNNIKGVTNSRPVTLEEPYRNSEENISPDNLSLTFVKQYLRIDHDFDDLEIQLYIKSAQSYVRNNLKLPKTEDMDIELVIPMLTLIAYFYENKTVVMTSKDKEDLIFGSILSMHRRDVL